MGGVSRRRRVWRTVSFSDLRVPLGKNKSPSYEACCLASISLINVYIMRGITPIMRLLRDFIDWELSSGRIVSTNRREVCKVFSRDFAKAAKSLMAFVNGTCLADAVVASVKVVK